jgi:hypothetical protein
MGRDGMNCAKHGTKGVDQDNHCESCEEEAWILSNSGEIRACWKCVHFCVPGGIQNKAKCELGYKLEPMDCGAYMREIGAEG